MSIFTKITGSFREIVDARARRMAALNPAPVASTGQRSHFQVQREAALIREAFARAGLDFDAAMAADDVQVITREMAKRRADAIAAAKANPAATPAPDPRLFELKAEGERLRAEGDRLRAEIQKIENVIAAADEAKRYCAQELGLKLPVTHAEFDTAIAKKARMTIAAAGAVGFEPDDFIERALAERAAKKKSPPAGGLAATKAALRARQSLLQPVDFDPQA